MGMGSNVMPEGVCPGLQGSDDASGQWLEGPSQVGV